MTVYKMAGAFRTALEERLRQKAKQEQIDISRLRRQLAFDRLLARLFHDDAAPWALKGGYALELQFKTARSTVDIDLTMFRPARRSVDSRIVRVNTASLDQPPNHLPECGW